MVRAAVARAGERPVLRAGLAISEGLIDDGNSNYEAERKHNADAVALFEGALGPSFELSLALNRYGNTLTELRKFTEARAALERSVETLRTIYGDGHPKIATVLNNLGWTAQEQGDWDGAASYHERALAIKERALGEHSSTATSLGNLGVVRLMQGRTAEALGILERAAAMSKQTAGPKHPNYARDLGNLASAYSELGRYADARQAHQTALAIKLEAYGEAHASTAYALENLAVLEARDHQLDAALGYARRALAARQRALGEEHQMTGLSWSLVAEVHADQGHCDVALVELAKSIAIVEKAVGPTSLDLIPPLTSQARCLVELDRGADALVSAERGTAIAKTTQPTPAARASLQFALGAARWTAAGRMAGADRSAAVADITAATAALRALGPSGSSGLAVVEAWLAKHPEVKRLAPVR
jgi:tetratricopeptide (TPR) repeat protein